MYIIDETYFIKDLAVPNSNELISKTGDELELFIDDMVRQCLRRALGYALFKDLDLYVLPEAVEPFVMDQDPVQFVAVGGETQIVLLYTPTNLLIFKNRIYQSSISDYSVAGSTITFNEALNENDVVDLVGSSIEYEGNNTKIVIDPAAPQKWLDLIYGVEYAKGDKIYKWNGLIYTEGTHKKSILAYYVFFHWLKENYTHLTGVGEGTGVAKNFEGVSPIQRTVRVWNKFVEMYQGSYYTWYDYYHKDGFVSLVQYLEDHREDFPDIPISFYERTNSLGL